jgi:nucleotide-binding universal stress UspA family protein
MSWKDILAIVLDADMDAPAIAAAEALADRFSAHLACAFLTPLPDEPLAYEPTVVAGVWAELLTRARAEAGAQRQKVDARLQQRGQPVELRTAEALSRDLGRVAAVHARYADIAVITRPVQSGMGELRDEIVEGVLHHSGRPALLVPPTWKEATIGKRVLIAWDASREATRAVAEARDLMCEADAVAIVTVDARPKLFGHGEAPGQNIAAHLSRCGLTPEVRNLDSMGRTVSQVIEEEAQAFNADLIVMGGYAHSRLRDLVFGGVTRDLMARGGLPILLAH